MALLPENDTDLLDEYLDAELNAPDEPSKTFRIDFNQYRVGNMTDRKEALKQYITKAILTPRSYYQIYNDYYGCELWDLIGQDVTDAFIDAEIPRMVREAIEYDDRILTVTDVSVARKGDAIFIVVNVDSVYGEVESEVTV